MIGLTRSASEINSDIPQPVQHGRWNLLWLLFSFNNRIDRTQFWVGQLALAGMAFAGLLLLTPLLEEFVPEDGAVDAAFVLLMPLIFWINTALVVKRFHDRDKSGWWTLVQFVPFIGSLCVLAYCGGGPGSYGANQYDNRTTLDASSFISRFVRFVPEIAILGFYLYKSLILAFIALCGLSGAQEANLVFWAIALVAVLVIYGLPLTLFGLSCWLHFRRRQYLYALLAMAPLLLTAVIVQFQFAWW